MRKHGAGYSRSAAIPPWEHNAVVARRRRYRMIARQMRTAQHDVKRFGNALRELGRSADRAADSLRDVRRIIMGAKP